IRLVLITELDHIKIAFQPKKLAGHGQRRAPLPPSRLACQSFGAGLLIEESLPHPRIHLWLPAGLKPSHLLLKLARRFTALFQPERRAKTASAAIGHKFPAPVPEFRSIAQRSSPASPGSRGKLPAKLLAKRAL